MGIRRSRLKLGKKEYALLRYEVFERDNWRCKVCRVREPLHAHHIIFRRHGGDDATWNLLTVCNDCHDAIHDRHVIIRPLKEGEPIDADKGVRIERINGWTPKKKVR